MFSFHFDESLAPLTLMSFMFRAGPSSFFVATSGIISINPSSPEVVEILPSTFLNSSLYPPHAPMVPVSVVCVCVRVYVCACVCASAYIYACMHRCVYVCSYFNLLPI